MFVLGFHGHAVSSCCCFVPNCFISRDPFLAIYLVVFASLFTLRRHELLTSLMGAIVKLLMTLNVSTGGSSSSSSSAASSSRGPRHAPTCKPKPRRHE